MTQEEAKLQFENGLADLQKRADQGETITEKEVNKYLEKWISILRYGYKEPLLEKQVMLAVDNGNGGVSIAYISKQSVLDAKIQEYKDNNIRYVEVTAEDLPQDRLFRDAWTLGE